MSSVLKKADKLNLSLSPAVVIMFVSTVAADALVLMQRDTSRQNIDSVLLLIPVT